MKIIKQQLLAFVTLDICIVAFFLLLVSADGFIFYDDGFRHMAMARKIVEEGMFSFPTWSNWFYMGAMHSLQVDPWWLYHVLLTPLTIFDIQTAFTIVTIAQISLVGIAFIGLLSALKIEKQYIPYLVILLFFGDSIFTGRLLNPRPYVLSTALTILIMTGCLRKNYILCSISLLIAILLSQLFVFPLLVLCIATAWYLYSDRRFGIQLLVTTLGTVAIGLLMHPQTIDYVVYIQNTLFTIPFLQGGLRNSELSSNALKAVSGAEIALFFSLLLLILQKNLRGKYASIKTSHFPLLVSWSLTLSVFLMCWNRAVDYQFPITLALVGLLITHQKNQLQNIYVKREKLLPIVTVLIIFCLLFPFGYDVLWPCIILGFILFFVPHAFKKPILIRAVTTTLVVITVVFNITVQWIWIHETAVHTYDDIQILQNLPKNSKILTPDWDYTALFLYYAPNLLYGHGIDQGLLHITDKELALALDETFSMEFRKNDIDLGPWIGTILSKGQNDYFVFIQSRHTNLIAQLKQKTNLEVTENDTIAIFGFPTK